MKITIEIECCDDDEALNHLTDIRRKVKKFLDDTDKGKATSPCKSFVHNNCDGYSKVDIDLEG